MEVHPFNKKFNREKFTCDIDALNHYLHRQASQDIRKKLAACFVIVDDDDNIIGYYTLSSAGINRDHVPPKFRKKIPHHYSVPVILLGRLAVDKNHKNKGYGAYLLVDALKRSYNISEKSIGAMAVIVDPINELAISFYEKYGFIKLEDSGKMFLPMQVVKKLFS